MRRNGHRPIQDEERSVTDPERSRKRTMDRAVRLLAAKPRSVGELRRRLLEKRWTNEEIVTTVIEKLTEYGYLDDKRFAHDLAAAKLRQKPQGRFRLARAFSHKEVDAEIVNAAIDAAYSEVPETAALDLAIERRIRLRGMPETPAEMKKLFDHLLRLGFGYGLIRDRVSVFINTAEAKQ
jgi:regulatory protein